jgi:hypothetical protein
MMRLNRLGAALLSLCCLISADALAQETPAQNSSSTSDWENRAGNTVPTRTSSSHSEADGRTVDRQSTQRMGANGSYETFVDVEREAVKVDATTTRVVEKRYGKDPNGGRALLQVSEEEVRDLPGGEQKVTRTVSNPDLNGGLQVARREIEQTKPIGADARESTTTVLSPDVNGGYTPSMRVQRRETVDKQGNVIEFRKSTLIPDGSGRWQVNEVREGSVKEEQGKGKSKEERVLRPDADGKLTVAARTVTRESEEAGKKRQTSETYSVDVPGTARDQNALHLQERTTTTSETGADGGSRTVQDVEQRNAGLPGDNVGVTQRTIDIVRPGTSGASAETRTIQTIGPSSGLSTVWVDTTNAKNSSLQVDTKPEPAKPAAKPKQ